ncbi:retrotransposon protein, putative, ty1-copia subclass [Tanacetum coccineum]
MCALLIQHGCEVALEVLPADIEAQTKAELNKKAHSAVILCLGNKVLREVTGETITTEVWSKLKTLYMTKSLANNLYLKKKLYTFYMPVSYEHFVDTLLYGREALTLEDGRTNRTDSRQSKGKSRSNSRGGRLKCYICQSEEHLKRNYLKNNRKKSTGYVKKDEQLSSIGLTYDDSKVMMVMSAQALLDWIMDSGCSYHMTPMLDILFDFLECDGGSVQLGDNKECKIRGIGKGFTIKLQSGKVKVINGSRVILSGIRRDNCVYSLDGHAMAGELNASVEEKESLVQVWHKRLGHIRETGLQVLEKQGLFGKKSLGKLDFCENCVLGKLHRFGFGVGRHTTQGVIDYVHSDLWGSSQVESLGGKRYFLSIVDDYSGRVYILRFKHEAFGKFKEWKQLVENQTERTVKKLRIDNGLEICIREFEQLCIKSGIARHLTVARMSQQNAVAERMNRTPMDKLRCKLKPRAIKCVLLGYPKGVKEYRLYRLDDESPKIVTSRNAVFNEMVMYKDTLKDSGAGADKSVEELQVEVELQRLNNYTPKEDQTDQEDGDDKDAWDQEIDQTPDLTDYHLAQDREPRTRTKSLRFRDESNMAAYAFVAAEEEDTHEPLTYQEAVSCDDSSNELQMVVKIKERIEGVQKLVRHTSILVILSLTACKDYELEQLDVKMAFLHRNLEEVIYMRQPPGYEQGNKVCLLKKSLYGLKQSPSKAKIRSTKSLLKKEFDMKELGEAKKILRANGKSVQMPLGGTSSYR